MARRRTRTALLLSVCILGLTAALAAAQQIDWNKAQRLHQKFLRGEKLTEEEREYHDRAAQALRAKAGAKRPPPPAKPPVGLKPLTDMAAADRYKGQDGGLYGAGRNAPPEEHLKAALQQAKLIRPLDGEGEPSEEGKIGFVSIGMSNTTQEFSAFVRLANASPAKSPKVVIVDGAQGGMTAAAWANPGARNPWEVLDQRLKQAGITAQQVQAAWIKQANAGPASSGEFPKHAEALKGHVVGLLHKLKEKFPNLRIACLSSRIYGGYARTPLNPEPYAYESAFVVRWLIQDQIQGDPRLNYDPEKGAVKSPLLLWGPYLWADGEKGRKIDGLVWRPEDLAGDGTHPSDSGRRKVAELLLRFMKDDPTAKTWFLGMPHPPIIDPQKSEATEPGRVGPEKPGPSRPPSASRWCPMNLASGCTSTYREVTSGKPDLHDSDLQTVEGHSVRTCQKCSKRVTDDSKICRDCGAILAEIPDGSVPGTGAAREPASHSGSPFAAEPPEAGLEEGARQSVAEAVVEPEEPAPSDAQAPAWKCPQCGETVPGTFDLCWKCLTTKDGEASGTEKDKEKDKRERPPTTIGWLHARSLDSWTGTSQLWYAIRGSGATPTAVNSLTSITPHREDDHG